MKEISLLYSTTFCSEGTINIQRFDSDDLNVVVTLSSVKEKMFFDVMAWPVAFILTSFRIQVALLLLLLSFAVIPIGKNHSGPIRFKYDTGIR
jgi:hypothetical protein